MSNSCDPVDHTLPGSSVHGFLQAIILDWIAMLSSRGSYQPRGQTCISEVSCIGRQVLYYLYHLETPIQIINSNYLVLTVQDAVLLSMSYLIYSLHSSIKKTLLLLYR